MKRIITVAYCGHAHVKKLSLSKDNDVSYSIPHRAKCWTEADNNLSQSLNLPKC